MNVLCLSIYLNIILCLSVKLYNFPQKGILYVRLILLYFSRFFCTFVVAVANGASFPLQYFWDIIYMRSNAPTSSVPFSEFWQMYTVCKWYFHWIVFLNSVLLVCGNVNCVCIFIHCLLIVPDVLISSSSLCSDFFGFPVNNYITCK